MGQVQIRGFRSADRRRAAAMAEWEDADLSLIHIWDLMVKPWCCDHSGHVVLILSDGTSHHIAHTVNQPYGKGCAALQLNLRRLLGNKFWLRCHDGPSRPALRQFIPGSFLAVDIFNVGDHLSLHKALDECGFSGAHRTHNADVDIARSAGCNILIDRGVHTHPVLFPILFQLYVRVLQSMTARLSL